MRNPKYHLYLTPNERCTVINSLIDLRNDLITQGKYRDNNTFAISNDAARFYIPICSQNAN